MGQQAQREKRFRGGQISARSGSETAGDEPLRLVGCGLVGSPGGLRRAGGLFGDKIDAQQGRGEEEGKCKEGKSQ